MLAKALAAALGGSAVASNLGVPRRMAISSGLMVLHLEWSEERRIRGSFPFSDQEPECKPGKALVGSQT